MNKKKLAIIGSGISGISSAYFLSEYFDITILEKEDYFGGHTRTIKVNDIDKCESMCEKAGINPIGIGALPDYKENLNKGFTLRGAVGELFEIVGV